MKIIIVVCVIVAFGAIGYFVKLRYENEYKFLKYVDDFVNYYYSNIVLFKNNTSEIIYNYIITHENKNAEYNKLFSKTSGIYEINEKILTKYILKKDNIYVIKTYLNQIGKSDYDYEKEKTYTFSNFLKNAIDESYLNLKNKGGLYFKILLSVGAILAILIW